MVVYQSAVPGMFVSSIVTIFCYLVDPEITAFNIGLGLAAGALILLSIEYSSNKGS